MIQRIASLSSARSSAHGSGLRHPHFADDREELQGQSVKRLVNARWAHAKYAIRRTIAAVRFRERTRPYYAARAVEQYSKPLIRGWLAAYGVDEMLLDLAVERAMRIIANPHAA